MALAVDGWIPAAVSLFTREWIEMIKTDQLKQRQFVSLFTREWIEIDNTQCGWYWERVSLFTREWIEILCTSATKIRGRRLPLYEGVD